MKSFIKTLGTLACAIALLAVPANAVQDPAQHNWGPSADQVLFVSDVTEIDGAGECVILGGGDGDVLSAACETIGVTQIIWPQDAYITAIKATLVLAGDTGYECDFQIEVGATGAVKGTLLNQATSTVVGTQNRQAQKIILEAGDFIGIVNTDGGGQACAGTADPKFIVSIHGRWVK